MQSVRRILNEAQVEPYNERAKIGWLKHVIVRVSFNQEKAMVILVTTQKKGLDFNAFADRLTKEVPEVVSIFQNINNRQGNRILGRTFHHHYGQQELVDTIGDLHFRISPASFFQINPIQTEKLYTRGPRNGGTDW